MKLARPFVTVFAQCLWLCAALALSAQAQDAQKPVFKPEELDQLVAPIALYPDSLLAQVLMASTYPLEIVEAARWSKTNPKVTGDALQKAMEGQTWDPSVKSLTAFPDVLAIMNDKLDWTQKLGDAFLAQQKDVMDSAQRLRAKAQKEGNLKSSKEQTVKTEAAPAGSTTTTIIEIAPSDPQVVYVPTYNPTVVYGAWPYPAYPPYPVYPPGAAFFSFTAGVIVGSALWGGCNWGHSDIDINVNNYNRFNNTNISNTNINNRNTNIKNNNQTWQHNPEHRKGVEYRDGATQQKFGRGSNPQAAQARDEFRGRAEQGRDQINREGAGNVRDAQGSQIGGQTRDAGGNRDQGGGQNRDLGGQSGDRAGQTGNLGQSRDAGGQSRDMGGANRSAASDRSRSPDAFSGMSSGGSTRAASSRGMSSRGGGGASRGGGRRR